MDQGQSLGGHRRRKCARRTSSFYDVFVFSIQILPTVKGKGSPYSITERRVPELISVLGSQPTGDVSHKPGGRLPLLSTPGAQLPSQPLRGLQPVSLLGEQRHDGCDQFAQDCYPTASRLRDLNPGPSAPESSTLTTRLPSHDTVVSRSHTLRRAVPEL